MYLRTVGRWGSMLFSGFEECVCLLDIGRIPSSSDSCCRTGCTHDSSGVPQLLDTHLPNVVRQHRE